MINKFTLLAVHDANAMLVSPPPNDSYRFRAAMKVWQFHTHIGIHTHQQQYPYIVYRIGHAHGMWYRLNLATHALHQSNRLPLICVHQDCIIGCAILQIIRITYLFCLSWKWLFTFITQTSFLSTYSKTPNI